MPLAHAPSNNPFTPDFCVASRLVSRPCWYSCVWTNLHFNVLQLLLFPVIPWNASIFNVRGVVIRSGEKNKPTVVKPPACCPLAGTVIVRPVVMVPVWGAELHPVVAAEAVRGGAGVIPQVQAVVIALPVNFKRLILRVNPAAVVIVQIHSKLVKSLVWNKENVVVSEPEFLGHLTEALPVGLPASVEVEAAVSAPHEHRPASRRGVHVTVHGYRTVCVERRDVVNPTRPVTGVVQSTTVCKTRNKSQTRSRSRYNLGGKMGVGETTPKGYCLCNSHCSHLSGKLCGSCQKDCDFLMNRIFFMHEWTSMER